MRVVAVLICLCGLVTSLVIATIGMSVGYISAPTRTLTFPEKNCACRIPYVWMIKRQDRFLLEASRLFGGTFILDAKRDPFPVKIGSESYANAIRQRMESLGYQITEEDHDPFEGCPTYSYSICRKVNGYTIFTHQTWFAVQNTRYLISMTKRDSDPINDAQLKAAMDSFTLLDSPSSTK